MAEQNLLTVAATLGTALKARGWMLATAESCTGGLVSATITEIAGSSAWFERGFVTYSNQSKIDMLGVLHETLEKYGAVSEEVAKEMAQGALRNSRADIALSITGIAGPDGGSAQKPVGTVCFAWACKNHTAQVKTFYLSGSRSEIRYAASTEALAGVISLIELI